MAPIDRIAETDEMRLTTAGILEIRARAVDTHNLEMATRNVAIATSLSGGVKRPVLVDMSKVRALENDARQYYASHTHLYASRCALLSTSIVGRMIANFYLSINKPLCPTRMFTDEAEAMAWLRQALVKSA